MSLIISHNLSAINTQRQLQISGDSMSKAIEKLSSGYKINVGADDPSGLIISEQLRSQISGLERAVRNSSEAFNLIGIAEGALNEMNNILKKMRALAIHACNNGVTSPEQVAADQSEMDSGIQTLDRIANTTRYSDQYLLNGSKELVYDRNTSVDEPTDHALIDTAMTRIDQVFKRSGVKMSVGFTGTKNSWQANTKTSAQRAYLETDAANPLCQVTGSKVTAKQEFILTGSGGSRLFSFAEGTHLGTIVDAVNNVRDSTGVGATLTFASNVRIDKTYNGGTYAAPLTGFATASYVYKPGDVQIYNAGLNNPETAAISDFAITANAAVAFKVGFNCDGDGKIYAKVVDKSTNSIEYYKDKECTMLIGKGDSKFFAATNNSQIPGYPTQGKEGIFLTLSNNAKNMDVYEIALVGQSMDNQKDMSVDGLQGWSRLGNSVMSGVNLGHNTSPEGSLFFRYTPVNYLSDGVNVKSFKVEVFNDSSMEPKYLVATSGEVANCSVSSPAAGGTGSVANGQTVTLQSVKMANGLDSGLNITLTIPMAGDSFLPTGEQVGSVAFTNLGMRIYSVGYGSQETIRIQNKSGELFYQYRESDSMEKTMVKSGTTVQVAGQDAQITLNGAPIFTNGLVANTTTPDFSGSIVFNSGSLGLTTLAVAGYEDGKLFSKSTDLQGVEENEPNIVRDARYFEPQSVVFDGTAMAMVDSLNRPVNIYMDFSQADPTVEARIITQLGAPSNVIMQYDGTTGMLTIDASGLVDGAGSIGGTPPAYSFKVDPEALRTGFYLTHPDLKGIFIKSEALVDATKSTGTGTNTQTTTPHNGELILEVNTYATNPRKTTTETMSNFLGGMQFQLGNTEGDQDRTVYSIQSMVMANLGRVKYNGQEYCLQDVLGGGVASLMKDPILAMKIVGQAVDDVSSLRARLGAFQANMLQTNINSLNVAVENITKTESAIRDTDMAAESTQFTRFQIMQQAGTSMLAQANQVSQNVLTLLR